MIKIKIKRPALLPKILSIWIQIQKSSVKLVIPDFHAIILQYSVQSIQRHSVHAGRCLIKQIEIFNPCMCLEHISSEQAQENLKLNE